MSGIIEKLREAKSADNETTAIGLVAVFVISFAFTTDIYISTGFSILALLIVSLYFFSDEIMEWIDAANEEKEIAEDDSEDEEETEEETTEVDYESLSASGDDLVFLGLLNDKPIIQKMGHVGNIFVMGMTRYGKTSELYGIIHHLITTYDDGEILLAFSDAKLVSFTIFSKLRNLFAPIATSADETEKLLVLVKTEMERRLRLFTEHEGRLCTNIDEYRDLSGEKLPRLIVFFDEAADSIPPKSEAEEIITTIAKMGLAAGIHLVIATQRPTNKGISHEVQSQCATTLCTVMRDRLDYSVAKIPVGVYENMRPEKGLFMLFTPEIAPTLKDAFDLNGWGYIKGHYVGNAKVEEAVREASGTIAKEWESKEPLPKWKGNEANKLEAIDELYRQLNRDVKAIDLVKAFGIKPATAAKWINKYEA